MQRCFLAAMLVLPFAVAISRSQEPGPKVNIDGSWLLTESTTPGGKKIPADLIAKLMGKLTIAKGGDYEQHAFGMKIESGKYKIDADKKPAWIDLNSTDGPNKGKPQLGIFKIESGKLTVALGKEGSGVRPTDFESTRKSEVSTYKRAD